MQPADDPDEQPVIYRTPRTPLLPTAQSPRAPWLHTATMTAVRFKQLCRFQTEKVTRAVVLSGTQLHRYLCKSFFGLASFCASLALE